MSKRKQLLFILDPCRPSTIAIRRLVRERAAAVLRRGRTSAEHFLAQAAIRLSVELDNVLMNKKGRKP